MATQSTSINTPGSNTYTVPTTLVGGLVSVTMYGAMGNGETTDYNGNPIPYAGPAPVGGIPWPGITTTGGKSSRIDSNINNLTPGQTLSIWIGDASGHGYHVGGVGSAGSGGGESGFQGGGSSAILTTAATPQLLLEAAGGGGAGGNAYGNFGSAHGGNGGKVFGAGYNGSVTPHTQCLGGGGGGGGGSQGVGATGLNTHTGHGATVVGGGGDSGVNQAGYAGGGGGGAGGSSFNQPLPVSPPPGPPPITVSATKFSDAAGTTTLGAVTLIAKVADAPLAPTLTGPYNGIYTDCTKPVNFSWTYNKAPDSGGQQSYALRIKLDSGAYQYWNASTQLLQSTQVWNTIGAGTTTTLPANIIANNHTVSWSVATAENYYGVQGPFAQDRTFPSGTTIKWQLVDPVTNESYAFAINPNTGGSLTRQKNVSSYATTADDSVVVLYEGSDSPQPVSVSGTLLTQAQYTAMVYWYSKRRQVLLIDDLGRNIWVYFVHFEPQRKWTVQSPWRHDWSAQFYVIGPQAVTAL